MLLIRPVLLPVTWICRIFFYRFWIVLFRVLAICLLLACFVSAAECHCFGLLPCRGCKQEILSGLISTAIAQLVNRSVANDKIASFCSGLYFKGLFFVLRVCPPFYDPCTLYRNSYALHYFHIIKHNQDLQLMVLGLNGNVHYVQRVVGMGRKHRQGLAQILGPHMVERLVMETNLDKLAVMWNHAKVSELVIALLLFFFFNVSRQRDDS